MQKTRKEAIDEFLRSVGEFGDVESRNLAENALTRAVESIWQEHPWRDFQSPSPIEMSLVSGQRSYPLPDYFGRLGLGRIRNLTTGRTLIDVDNRAADEFYPTRGTSLESTGEPRHILLGGICGVQRQPLYTGEACEIVSSSALDVDNVQAGIVAADGDGNVRRQRFTVTGTVPVAIGTFGWFDDFGKSYIEGVEPTIEGTSSAGTITLRIVSSGIVLQQLYPEESAREHRIVTFLPKPNVTHTIALPCMRRPPRLLYDADVLPGDWWNAIFEEMRIEWKVQNGDLAADSVVPRPHRLKLIGHDNAARPQPTIRPFGS